MKYFKFLLLLSCFSLLYGCGEEEVKSANTLSADAFIRAIKINNEIHYSPIFLAKTTTAPKTVTVSDSKNKNDGLILISYWNNNLNFRWIPSEENYTKTIEKSKSYTFTAFFEGEEKTENQTVNLSEIPKEFEIKEIKYNKEKRNFTISWTDAKADTYMVQICKKLDEYPIFQSINLKTEGGKDENKLFSTTLNSYSLQWFKTPTVGEEYLLCIHAFNMEGEEKISGEFIATQKFIWEK